MSLMLLWNYKSRVILSPNAPVRRTGK